MGIEVLQEELLQTHRGQFALIKGRRLIGIYPTRLEAYTEGVKRYLAGPFLMKQILDVEPVEQILLFACSVSKRADLQPLLAVSPTNTEKSLSKNPHAIARVLWSA